MLTTFVSKKSIEQSKVKWLSIIRMTGIAFLLKNPITITMAASL